MKGKVLAVKQAKRLLSQMNFDPDSYDLTRSNGCVIDVEAIAKRLNISLIPSELPDEVSGVFFRKNGELFLGFNQNHNEHRQRFTIAHEIGHYKLHATENLHYDKNEIDTVYFRANDVSNLEEIEANHFAAELLMPELLIDRCIGSRITVIDDLAQMFNVSEPAMRYRLINLGYL